ncbi:MAG: ribose 5-phosphate isomerase B [Candidatus Cloacimonadota bacterium]|nr:MAG: ribose 5-phosphate isomerase B [Candidatus Cloacimonadota bacterium]
MKIAIASDHAGYKLKEEIKKYLRYKYVVKDFGTNGEDAVDYPEFGFPAAECVANGICDRGIVICGTGIGMSIVANKVKGIRAALCYCGEIAELSRRHNNANVLVLAGKYLDPKSAKEIIDIWLTANFDKGRHQRRIDKICKYEISHFLT